MRGLDPEAAHQIPNDLRRARRLRVDQVDGAEPRVVVVVVDVDQMHARLTEGLGWIALQVAAVHEHHRALVEVLRRLGEGIVER